MSNAINPAGDFRAKLKEFEADGSLSEEEMKTLVELGKDLPASADVIDDLAKRQYGAEFRYNSIDTRLLQAYGALLVKYDFIVSILAKPKHLDMRHYIAEYEAELGEYRQRFQDVLQPAADEVERLRQITPLSVRYNVAKELREHALSSGAPLFIANLSVDD